jgi:hypothetical protein
MVTGNKTFPMPAYVDPHTSFFDKSFDQTSLHAYILSIQVSRHGLDFSIYDNSKNKYIALQSFKFVGIKDENKLTSELETVFKESDWLTTKFQKVNFLYSNPGCTLIPQALFTEQEKNKYLAFNQPVSDGFVTEFNILKNASAVNVFQIPVTLLKRATSTWKDLSIYHTSSVFIESLLINYKNKVGNKTFFVHAYNEYFEIVYLKDGKLYYHNTFHFRTKEDFIYFLLAALEQLKLNPEEVKIVMSGAIDKSSIYYEMVYQYIRNSEFIERNDTFNYSYVMDKLAHHKHYVLFNSLQCE